MSLENKDFVARIQRIAEALAAIADEKTPEVIEEFGDDALSQVERQVNHAIRALDHRLQERVLFSIGPCIVFRWRNTAGWPVEYVSPNVADLTGYPVEDFASQTLAYASLVFPDDLKRVTEEVGSYSASGVDWFEHEPYRIRRRDGKTVWISDYSVIRRNPDGEITHYFGYIFDITERVEQAQKLTQTEQAMKQLASPVLRVWEGVVAVPLFGVVDERRATDMTNRLLEEVSTHAISYSILDLTGLDSVDEPTMTHLVNMVRAVSLLGSTCLLSGISPTVARVIVELGLDVSAVATFSTLSAALGHALGKMGRKELHTGPARKPLMR